MNGVVMLDDLGCFRVGAQMVVVMGGRGVSDDGRDRFNRTKLGIEGAL